MDPKGRGKDINVFPRNLLRNVAIDNSYTDHVLLLDMDLVIADKSYAQIKSSVKIIDERSKNGKKYALVVPAFECKRRLNDSIASSKLNIKEELSRNKRSYIPFLSIWKKEAHYTTNYKKWFKSTEIYPINAFQKDYEPYIVVRKDTDLPPFWEHFTGFGRNKLQWIEEVILSGHDFFVEPNSFVVHKHHDGYGLRKVRPFVADEYVQRFQRYISYVYGRHVDSMKILEKWRLKKHKEWKYVKKELKTEEVSREKTNKVPACRDEEMETCLKTINERHIHFNAKAI